MTIAGSNVDPGTGGYLGTQWGAANKNEVFTAIGGLQGGIRSYSNLFPTPTAGQFGHHWYSSALPTLVERERGLMSYTGIAQRRIFFQGSTEASYQTFFDSQSLLSYDQRKRVFIFTGPGGIQAIFAGEDGCPGRILAFVTAGGVRQDYAYDGQGRVLSLTRVVEHSPGTANRYEYEYRSADSRLVALVTLRVAGVAIWRQRYAYYAAGDLHGLEGDLKSVVEEESAGETGEWRETNRVLYRYYTEQSGGGFPHGLKFQLDAGNWERMRMAGLDAETAPDEHLAPYATVYFEYQGESRRIITERHAGTQTHTFTYETQEPTWGDFTEEDFNRWTLKIVHTLPSGSRDIYYANQYGQVILKVMSAGEATEACHHARRDSRGRITMLGGPSAVKRYAEDAVPMAEWQKTGCLRTYTYSPRHNLAAVSVRDESDGILKLVRKVVFGAEVDGIEYPTVISKYSEKGDEVARTTYAYTFYDDTFQMSSRVTNQELFGVLAAQETKTQPCTELFDKEGHRTWLREADGGLTAYFYDPVSGQLAWQINEVNTDLLPPPSLPAPPLGSALPPWISPVGKSRHVRVDGMA